MQWSFLFFFNSILLGVGLAMDAFSVSLANGLNEPEMGNGRMNMIAGTYSFFQFAMPMIGWVCVHFIVEKFRIAVRVTVAVVSDCCDEVCLFSGQLHLDFVLLLCHDWYLF